MKTEAEIREAIEVIKEVLKTDLRTAQVVAAKFTLEWVIEENTPDAALLNRAIENTKLAIAAGKRIG